MAATRKQGLLLLGLATAVLATPVTGIEVRQTSPPCASCFAQSPALPFARSLAFDFVRRSPECVSTYVFPVLEREAPRGRLVCIRSSLLNGVEYSGLVQSSDPVANSDNRILTPSQS
jgi:hypothetical protein